MMSDHNGGAMNLTQREALQRLISEKMEALHKHQIESAQLHASITESLRVLEKLLVEIESLQEGLVQD